MLDRDIIKEIKKEYLLGKNIKIDIYNGAENYLALDVYINANHDYQLRIFDNDFDNTLEADNDEKIEENLQKNKILAKKIQMEIKSKTGYKLEIIEIAF